MTIKSAQKAPSSAPRKPKQYNSVKFKTESLFDLLKVVNDEDQPIFIKLQDKKQYSIYKKLIKSKRRSFALAQQGKEMKELGLYGVVREAQRSSLGPNLGDENAINFDKNNLEEPNRHGITFLEQNHELKPNFDPEKSTREHWWRQHVKDTPIPGTYESKDFLSDPQQNFQTRIGMTSSFKIEQPRKMKLWHDDRGLKSGDTLLPGFYGYNNHSKLTIFEELRKRECSAAFKAPSRNTKLFWEKTTTELKSQPKIGQYNITPTLPKLPHKTGPHGSHHSFFKSKTDRKINFSNGNNFEGKSGSPSPDTYDYEKGFGKCGFGHFSGHESVNLAKAGFESGVDRFIQKRKGVKTPGPGSYEIQRFDRYAGLSIGPKRIY